MVIVTLEILIILPSYASFLHVGTFPQATVMTHLNLHILLQYYRLTWNPHVRKTFNTRNPNIIWFNHSHVHSMLNAPKCLPHN